MTSAMEARTGESNTLQERHELVKNVGGSRTQQEFVGKAQAIVNHAANDLNEFVSALEPLVDRYKTTSLGLFSNLQGGLFAEGNTIENREEARVELQSLVSAMAETKKNVAAMQASISQLPALTSRFRKAKQRTAMVLGRLVAELLVTENEAVELIGRIASEKEA